MCRGIPPGPPYGLPITEDVHELYSEELKQAWLIFDAWWQSATSSDPRGLVHRSNMPEDVKQAMQLILDTPIPGYEGQGITGRDSCYMVGVLSSLVG